MSSEAPEARDLGVVEPGSVGASPADPPDGWRFARPLSGSPRPGAESAGPQEYIHGQHYQPETARHHRRRHHSVHPEEIIQQLRTLQQHVPDYAPLPTVAAGSLQAVASVSDDMVQAGISALGASTSLSSALGHDSETTRLERDDISRWRAVEDELRTTLQGVTAGNLKRRHRLGLTTLQTYSIARQLIRHPQHANLIPHVNTMRRLNKMGRRKLETTPETPTPNPNPNPKPAPPQQ